MRLNTNPEQTQNTIITINTFLNFEGNCENVLNFYRSVFGGKFSHVGRFSGMPANPDYPVADEFGNQIKHIRLPISKGIHADGK